MRVLVTGASGFVGLHVVRCLKQKGCILLSNLEEKPDAIIHLAWAGLPNYESLSHYGHLGWQVDFLRRAVESGVCNITVAGTCLETLDVLTPYAIAKLALRARAFELLPELKWARLWYLYGEGQNEDCLLPQLRKAKRAGKTEFSIIDGKRDFIDVADAAEQICAITMQLRVTGIIDCCSGVAESVLSFCQRHASQMKFKLDYPRPYYEPFSFCGDPWKLGAVKMAEGSKPAPMSGRTPPIPDPLEGPSDEMRQDPLLSEVHGKSHQASASLVAPQPETIPVGEAMPTQNH